MSLFHSTVERRVRGECMDRLVAALRYVRLGIRSLVCREPAATVTGQGLAASQYDPLRNRGGSRAQTKVRTLAALDNPQQTDRILQLTGKTALEAIEGGETGRSAGERRQEHRATVTVSRGIR